MSPKFLFLLLLGSAFVRTANAALMTNRWSGTAGGEQKWETASDWSLGVPPSLAPSYTVIDQKLAGNGKRNIVIDADTVASNAINGCLTISNLTTSISVNVLHVDDTGSIALTVLDSLSVSNSSTLSISNSTVQVSTSGIYGGIFDDGSILLNTGTLIDYTGDDSPVYIGYNGVGQMTMSDGLLQTYFIVVGFNAGSEGTLTVAGGTVDDDQQLSVGAANGGTGTVWLTGGQLIQSSDASGTSIGGGGVGQMTISNGIWQTASDNRVGTQGTLTIAGGSSTFGMLLAGGTAAGGGTGTIWMTGGQLLTSYTTSIGWNGNGQMTVSNGTWQAGEVVVGDDNAGPGYEGTGMLTMDGGTNTLTSTLSIGYVSGCTGTVWLTGGLLTTLDDTTYVAQDGVGRMTVSNGTWLAKEVDIGSTNFGRMTIVGGSIMAQTVCIGCATNGPIAPLTMTAGSLTVLGNLEIGNCTANGFAFVQISGGTVYVTNAAHNAVLDVRNGYFLLEGGTLVVDMLVATNECDGIFDHIGGTLTVGTLILDPNGDVDGDGLPNGWEQAHGLDPLSSTGNNGADGDPDGDGYSNYQEYLAGSDPQNPLSTPLQIVAPPFQITSIVQSGNNIVLIWNTAGGLTNQIEVTSGGTGGSYSTNGFTSLGPQLLIGGSGLITTNYTDTGGATNKPARYYRVRLVP